MHRAETKRTAGLASSAAFSAMIEASHTANDGATACAMAGLCVASAGQMIRIAR